MQGFVVDFGTRSLQDVLDLCVGREHIVEPILIVGGRFRGRGIIPARVLTAPGYEYLTDVLNIFRVVEVADVDTGIAWPDVALEDGRITQTERDNARNAPIDPTPTRR